MVTDAQVRLLRQKRLEGKKLETAAAAAGTSERTARAWQAGPLPSESQGKRWWRPRDDPFAEVWEDEIVPLLESDTKGVLESTTLFAVLEEKRLHLRPLPGAPIPNYTTVRPTVRRWSTIQVHERGKESPRGRGILQADADA